MTGPGREKLWGEIEPVLERAGFELVDLKLVPRGGSLSVQVFIDHLDGLAAVNLGDCSRASRVIADEVGLDQALPGRYRLEVSSPGVNRPLRRPAHFRRFSGQPAVVKLAGEGGQSLRGTIVESDDEAVTLDLEGGRRERIAYAEIASAHLKLDPWAGRRKRTDSDER